MNVADFPRSSTAGASARGVYKLPEIFLIGMRTDSLKEIFSGSDQVTLTIVAFLYTQADFEQVEPLPTTKSLRAQRSNLDEIEYGPSRLLRRSAPRNDPAPILSNLL
jgi:hypothetical protein